MTAATPTGPEQLAAQLAQITADLDGHIERRAQELAEPLILKANERAETRVKEVEFELQRQTDLVKELQRQMKPLLRQSDQRGQVWKVIRAWSGRSRGPLERQTGELLREVSAALNARPKEPTPTGRTNDREGNR